MTRYLHELFFLSAAIAAGSLSLRPAIAPFRRQLLWSGFLLVTCALLLVVGGEVPWLHQTLPNGSPALNTALRVVLWCVVALIGAMLLKFALSRWYFAETGQPRGRKLFADLLAGLIYLIAGIGILLPFLARPFLACWRPRASWRSSSVSLFRIRLPTSSPESHSISSGRFAPAIGSA